MSQKFILKPKGLCVDGNPVTKFPDGSVVRADGVILSKDGIFSKAFGYKVTVRAHDSAAVGASPNLVYPISWDLYASRFFFSTYVNNAAAANPGWAMYYGDAGGSPPNIFGYRNRFSETNVSKILPPSQDYGPIFLTDPVKGGRAKFKSSGKNLYFTSSAGIMKLDSNVGTETPGAGVPGASEAGWRAPQDPSVALLMNDGSGTYGRGFLTADSACAYRITWSYTDLSGNLVESPPSGRVVIRNAPYRNSALVKAAGTGTVTLPGGSIFNPPLTGAPSVGDFVDLNPIDALNVAPATKTVNASSNTTVSYAEAGVGSASIYTLTLGTRPTRLTIPTAPSVGGKCILKIYRSKRSASADSEPSDEMYLCFQGPRPGGGTFDDYTPDALLGDACYTNPSQEGISQANDRPPAARDMELYQQHMFYANGERPHRFIFQILSVLGTSGIQNNDTIKIGHRTYTATTSYTPGAGQFTLFNQAYLTTQANIRETARSLVQAINADTSSEVTAYYLSGPTDAAGKILLELASYGPSQQLKSGNPTYTNGFDVHLGQARTCYVPQLPQIGTTFTISAYSKSVGGSVLLTCTGLISGIAIGDYVNVVPSATTSLRAGRKLVTGVSGLTMTFMDEDTGASSGALGGTVHKSLSTSDNERRTNRVYIGKPRQCEAVPLQNFLDVGSDLSNVDRIMALGGSLFVFNREDGIFRILGDDVSNFRVVPFDPTVKIDGPDTLDSVSNTLMCWTNQGLAAITESGVTIIDRPIDSQFEQRLHRADKSNNAMAVGCGVEDERLYFLSMPGGDTLSISTGANSQQFVFNLNNQSWTRTVTDCLFMKEIGSKVYRSGSLGYGFSVESILEDTRTIDPDKTPSVSDSIAGQINYDSVSSLGSEVYRFVATAGQTALLNILNANLGVIGIKQSDQLTWGHCVAVNVGGSTFDVKNYGGAPQAGPGSMDVYLPTQAKVKFLVANAGDPTGLKLFRAARLLHTNPYFTTESVSIRSDFNGQTGSSLDVLAVSGYASNQAIDQWLLSPYDSARALLHKIFEFWFPRNSRRASMLEIEVQHLKAIEVWDFGGISESQSDGSDGKVQR